VTDVFEDSCVVAVRDVVAVLLALELSLAIELDLDSELLES
jgi:hypothetical protein